MDRTFAAQRRDDKQHECLLVALADYFADPTVEFRIVLGQHACQTLDRRTRQRSLIDKFMYFRLHK